MFLMYRFVAKFSGYSVCQTAVWKVTVFFRNGKPHQLDNGSRSPLLLGASRWVSSPWCSWLQSEFVGFAEFLCSASEMAKCPNGCGFVYFLNIFQSLQINSSIDMENTIIIILLHESTPTIERKPKTFYSFNFIWQKWGGGQQGDLWDVCKLPSVMGSQGFPSTEPHQQMFLISGW